MVSDSDESPTSTLSIDEARRLIRMTLRGSIDDVESFNLYKRVSSLPEFRSGFSVLFDCTQIGTPIVTGPGQLELANLSQNDTNRVAILVSNPATFGMARMYEICANWNGERVGVFLDEESALRWLGVHAGERVRP